MFAEFLAIGWMLDHEAGVKKSLPVFGGDFNNHMIVHQPSSRVLHFMKHDPDDAGKQCAVACMRHLIKQDNMLSLDQGRSFYFYHVLKAFAHNFMRPANGCTSFKIVVWQIVSICLYANSVTICIAK